ncbi:hypothetical protein NADE_008533 [Nannochloris sp. 'desiccata']|nr:hypothetical protein NADE_008533 [Chlorella desiccata (nom. nud.)]
MHFVQPLSFKAAAPRAATAAPHFGRRTFSGVFFLQCHTFHMPQKMMTLLLMLNLRRRLKHSCLKCGPIFRK